MRNQQLSYRFYPSLLDKFQRYLDANKEFESQWNIDSEGNYKKTMEEIEAELLQSLLDSINRVPFESEAADKGTVFNEIVDAFIHHQRPESVKMIGYRAEDAIYTEYNDRKFTFSFSMVEQAAEYFAGAESQVKVSAVLPTRYGDVELYGYIDELVRNKVYDIKTTARYEFGKYAHYWQRHVYPYCLIESGECTEIDSFEFTAYQLKGGTKTTPLITATQYPEVYKYNHAESTERLRQMCERFIEFIEQYRDRITDKKIFNQLEDEQEY